MNVLARAIECFVLAVFCGLLPVAVGFALGWIARGEKDGK